MCIKNNFMKNNAFFLKTIKKPLAKAKNLKLPSPGPYHVMVKIIYSGICGSQLKEIDGKRGHDKYIPHLLGHEGFGKVIRTGSRVKKIKKDDFVLLSWIKGKGGQEKNLKIKYNKKKINSGPITTFSNLSLISENRCFKLSNKSYQKKFIPLLGCSLPTGVGLVYKDLKPKKNKSFVVSGIGAVGIFSLLGIMFFKPRNIIVLETNIYKMKFLKKYLKNIKIISATYSKKKIIEKIKLINEGDLADYAIDCSGDIQAMNNCIDYIKNNGKFIFASHPDHNKKLQINPHELIKGKKIMGSWGGGFKIERDEKILNYFLQNVFLKSNFRKFIKCYKLNNINQAIYDIKKGKIFKALLIH